MDLAKASLNGARPAGRVRAPPSNGLLVNTVTLLRSLNYADRWSPAVSTTRSAYPETYAGESANKEARSLCTVR